MRKIGRKNGILLSWLTTYCIVIGISFLSLFVIYSVNKNVISEENVKNNALIIDIIKRNTDELLESMEKVAISLSDDQEIRELACNYNELNDEARFRLGEMPGKLSGYSGVSKWSNACYLYFESLGKIVSCNETMDVSELLERSKLKISDMEWRNLISNDMGNRVERIPMENDDCRFVYVLRSFYTAKFGKQNVSLVYILKDTDIVKENEIENMNFYLKNKNDIVSIRSAFDFDKGILDKKLKNGVFLPLQDSFLYSAVGSAAWNMQYVIVSNEQSVFKNLYRLKNQCLIITFIGLFIALIIAYFFARDNFNSIKKISDSLSVYVSESDNLNSMRGLSNFAVNVMKNYTKIANDNILKREKIQRELVRRLLHGDYGDKKMLPSDIPTEDLNFLSERFAVVVVSVDESFNMIMNYHMIANLIKDTCSIKHSSTVIDENGFIVCVINFCNEINVDTLLGDIVEIKNSICDTLKNGSYIGMKFASSGIVNGMENISVAFNEAMSIMDYKNMTKNDNIFFMNDIKEFHEKTGIYYTFDQEKNFINAIVIGRPTIACDILDEVVKNISTNSSLMLVGYKYFMFDILCSMVKAANQIGEEALSFMIQNHREFESGIERANSAEGYAIRLKEAITKLCGFVKNDGDERSLKNLVTEIINENYSDCNLCLNYIADKLKLHPVYLSSSFKSQFGMGISTLTEKIRLEKATELLGKNEGVSRTAEAVGYSNVQTFSKAFKRKYGVSPSEWIEKK